ncbi:MAG TPA: DUF429 domain-containing protein [Myxococcota bacterium]|nr:DUF429 domain-containing protein [Myxococcota bacterium]
MAAVGVDGCRGGWIAATRAGARRIARVAELFACALTPTVVAIDIPIGLTDAGPRRCDAEARRRLGPARGASVFAAPIRPMLPAQSHAEACALGRAADGRALSLQCWGIVPKIREVDALVCADAAARGALREVSPELSFALMNGGKALAAKRSAAGALERRQLVEAAFGAAARRALTELHETADVLDAFAALWSAERITRGEALVLPADPPRDAWGIAMSISA